MATTLLDSIKAQIEGMDLSAQITEVGTVLETGFARKLERISSLFHVS